MAHCYINGVGCVSTQDTSDYKIFLETQHELTENIVRVHKPNYRDFIKPAMIRRMANGVKNGVVASAIALKEANIKMPEAIITGTGMGCTIDSGKFLKNIIDNKEQFLTPTAFIQSTHNTVGGQIALGLQCKAYNVTYVHKATSFEASLVDALLMINDNETNILVGGVDEIGDYSVRLHQLIGLVKNQETLSNGLLQSNSKGVVYGEGAQFFALENQKKETTYAELIDVEIYDNIDESEIHNKLLQFLKTNGLAIADVDLVVLGNNGDVKFDFIYNNLQDNLLKSTQQIYYKHLSGEYHTASSFGLWIAAQICKIQEIPKFLKLNNKEVATIKNVLLYNQYLGENHSFTLLRSC